MLASKEIVVNLGTNRVTAAVFSFGSNGIGLEKMASQTTFQESISENQWILNAGSALKSLCKTNSIKGNAKVILPSSQLLSKTLRVPKVEQSKQRNIVSYELGQKMPVPLEEMVWDFQVIDDDGIEQEILAYAVKPEFIEEVCRIVCECGLTPTHFCPGPILDNEVLSKSEKLHPYTEKMLINFGARSTNLIFSNTSGYLVRTINLGGNSLTESLSESFGIPLDKAEELKLNYFANHLNLKKEDPAIDVLKTASHNYYNKTVQEITRSLVTYKRLKKGKSPQIIVATGCPAQNPDFIQFLSQAQALPVLVLDPRELVRITDGISEQEESQLPYNLTESLGFALLSQANDSSKKVINLLPLSLSRTIDFKKKKIWLGLAAIFLAVCPLPSYWAKMTTEKNERKFNTVLKEKLKSKEEALNKVGDQNKYLSAHQIINQKGVEFVTQFTRQSKLLYSQPRLINSFQAITQSEGIENIWIDSIQYVPTNQNTSNNEAMPKTTCSLVLQGRYLLAVDVKESDSKGDKNNKLIDANSAIQDLLTERLSGLPQVTKLEKKVFSTDGKGDLFNRFYTHFEIQLSINLAE